MNYEKLITFGIIGLVFVLRMKAQNKRRKQMKEEKARQAEQQKPQQTRRIEEEVILPRQPAPPLVKPKPIQKISERGFEFHRDIEERTLDRKITSRELKTQFAEKKQLISDGLKDKISIDATYAIKARSSESRISSLVSGVGSRRKLFLINEILNPPYID